MAAKPRASDGYHSCYVLSGLSSAQHQWELALSEDESAAEQPDPMWVVLPYLEQAQIFHQGDRVRPIHPVYAIPQQNQRAMRNYFLSKQGF
jgi:protein farnesyltransferase subunit beta